MEVHSISIIDGIKPGRARKRWRQLVESRLLNQRQAQVGRSSKHQHGGVVIHDLNLLHHQDKQDQWSQWRYPCPVVDSRIPEGVRLAQRPRPSGSGGSSVDPAWGNPILWRPRGQQVSRRSSGAMEAWRGRLWGIFTFIFTFERKWKSF